MKKASEPRYIRTPMDAILGQKIKLRRRQLSISQKELATILGITFQQVQKYETGTNRISVSRLMDICRALNVNAAYFLEDMDTLKVSAAHLNADVGGLRLLKYYEEISEPKIKRQLLSLAKSLAD